MVRLYTTELFKDGPVSLRPRYTCVRQNCSGRLTDILWLEAWRSRSDTANADM